MTPRDNQSDLIEAAVSERPNTGQAFFHFNAPGNAGGDGKVYVASVAPIPEIFGGNPPSG